MAVPKYIILTGAGRTDNDSISPSKKISHSKKGKIRSQRREAAYIGKSLAFLLPFIKRPQSSIKRVQPPPNHVTTHWECHCYLQEPHTCREAAGGKGRIQPGPAALSEGCKHKQPCWKKQLTLG